MAQEDDRLMELAHGFVKVNRLLRAYCDRLMAEIDMHRSQHMILMNLAHQKTKTSQKELADRLEISPAAVTVMIKKLEKGGFISKNSSKGDSRFNEIAITEKGRETVQKTHQFFLDVDKTLFSGIDETELCVLEHCFAKMADNLTDVLKKEENT